MTDEPDNDNVIQFSLAYRPAGSALGHKPWTSKAKCTHRSVLVEESTREVTCSHCEVVLDAFAVLLQYANEERRFEWSSQESKRELKERTAKCEQLVAEEKRLKSRVRAAAKRDPEGAMSAQLARQEHNRSRTVINANEAIEVLQKIVRANGGTTREQGTWKSAARLKNSPPTRVYFAGDKE